MVFSTFGGMSYECDRFVKDFCEMASEKLEEKPRLTNRFITTKYSFSFLRTSLLCVYLPGSAVDVRGRRKLTLDLDDIGIEYTTRGSQKKLKKHSDIYYTSIF